MFAKIENDVIIDISDKKSGKGKYIELPLMYEHFISINTVYKNKDFVVNLQDCKEIAKILIKEKRKNEAFNSIIYKKVSYSLDLVDLFRSKDSGFLYKDGNTNTFLELTNEDVFNITSALVMSSQNLFDLEYEADNHIDQAKNLLDVAGYVSFYSLIKSWSWLGDWNKDFEEYFYPVETNSPDGETFKIDLVEEVTPDSLDLLKIRSLLLSDPDVIALISSKIKDEPKPFKKSKK